MVAQITSNFATWVSGSDHGLPRKYGMCTISMIIGAMGRLAIIVGNIGNVGGVCIVCGKTNIGKCRGVKGFWIAYSCEVLEVEPKCSCCGLRGDNPSSWPLFAIGI